MHDCAKNLLAYHDDRVTLPQPLRTNMRDRRNANRDRLTTRLKEDGKPLPKEFIKQGSYAMLTMVQDADNDYDIDDGIYFLKDDLKDKNGTEMSPKDVRQMICDSLKDDRFTKQPEVRGNCVRVFYQEGYHVDMPVYRIDGEKYELAAGDTWVHSRAADVEDWFNNVNQTKSPDEENGRQFRRIVRYLKKFARSRKAWKDPIATGFTITKLAEECYVSNKNREDESLRDTMKAIRTRLIVSLEVNHPVTPGAKLTKSIDDKSTTFFREKLVEALKELEILDDPKCSGKQAATAWDKVFNTDFFSLRNDEAEKSANEAALAGLIASKSNPVVVEKRGGDRFA